MSKITTNYLYNVILTLSSYLINIVLFPYVSRVLGVDMIGKLGFVNETVTYFSLFALMGIMTVGIREVAAVRNDRQQLSRVFSSLVVLVSVMTAIVLAVYFAAVFTVDRFSSEKTLFFLGSCSLLATSYMLEWFYQGLENFRYISLRTILIRLIYAASVFLFVKQPGHYLLYFALTVGSIVANALINILYSRQFADFSFHGIQVKKFIKPVLSLGVYKIMVSMYTTFNVVYLGFVSNETEVGYYYTSKKLFYLILGLFTAFTSVMLPRMSSLLATHEQEEFDRKIRQTFDIVFSMAFPVVVFGVVMAPQIIALMSGPGYEGAVLPMRIMFPVLLLSGMAQIWVIEILLPMRKDMVVLVSSVLGAATGILANLLLVGKLGAMGSALVLLLSEVAGNIIGFIYVLRKGYMVFPVSLFLQSLLSCLPYIGFCLLGCAVFSSDIGSLIIAAAGCLAWFLVYNLWIYRKGVIARYAAQYLSKR